MNKVITCMVLVALVAFSVFAADAIELEGKWEATMKGHSKTRGFAETVSTFEFVEQNGNAFKGVYQRGTHGEGHREGFSGVIGSNGEKLYIVEHEDGFVFGDILSQDMIALYYLESPSDSTEDKAVAIYCILQRVPEIPNLVGTWQGEIKDAHREADDKFSRGRVGEVHITDQDGRAFTGFKIAGSPEGQVEEGFSGVISADGKNLYIAEHESDLMFGDILSEDHIHLYYLKGSDARALNIELKRTQ